jgi:hypothetical protein
VQYVDAVTLASGTVKNNSALYVGSDNSQSTSRGGTATVTISGGAWDQGGSA